MQLKANTNISAYNCLNDKVVTLKNLHKMRNLSWTPPSFSIKICFGMNSTVGCRMLITLMLFCVTKYSSQYKTLWLRRKCSTEWGFERQMYEQNKNKYLGYIKWRREDGGNVSEIFCNFCLILSTSVTEEELRLKLNLKEQIMKSPMI